MPIACLVAWAYEHIPIFGAKPPQFTPSRLRLVSSWRTFNCNRAVKLLAYQPIFPLEVILKRVWNCNKNLHMLQMFDWPSQNAMWSGRIEANRRIFLSSSCWTEWLKNSGLWWYLKMPQSSWWRPRYCDSQVCPYDLKSTSPPCLSLTRLCLLWCCSGRSTSVEKYQAHTLGFSNDARFDLLLFHF